MIDSVSMRFHGIHIPEDRLDGGSVYVRGQEVHGKVQNLRVRIDAGGSFIKGSLPKFLKGHNVLALKKEEIEAALALLEQQLGVDLAKGQVVQLETGFTIPVEQDPCNYTETWLGIPRYEKDIFACGQTVTFRNCSSSFIAYDKGEEILPNELPEAFPGKNALRMELRFLRKLKQKLGRPITLQDLANPDVLRALVTLWHDFYFSIPKMEKPVLNIGKKTAKDLIYACAAVGIEGLGPDFLLARIKQAYKSGKISRSTASQMRKKVLEALTNESTRGRHSLNRELDEKVREIANRKI
jgi:hypothetical protein